MTPKDVVCPTCFAAVGGRCLEPVKDGSIYIDHYHETRIELATKGYAIMVDESYIPDKSSREAVPVYVVIDEAVKLTSGHTLTEYAEAATDDQVPINTCKHGELLSRCCVACAIEARQLK